MKFPSEIELPGKQPQWHRLPTQLEVDEMVRQAHEDHARAIREALRQAATAVVRGAGKALRQLRIGGWSRA